MTPQFCQKTQNPGEPASRRANQLPPRRADTPAPRHAPTLNPLPAPTLRALLTLTTLLTLQLAAYPPAPDHLIYGTVRDELGNALEAGQAEVVLETLSGVQVKSAVKSQLEPGVNYRLPVPMDAGITPDLYKPNALHSAVPFKIKVRIGDLNFLPIEMRGNFSQLGRPGGQTRLNLTLGEDSDGDGLPDAWERALLAQLKSGNSLEAIDPSQDSDGDGLNNYHEYLSGTYAFDSEDGFQLKAIRSVEAEPRLEFMAIRGRTYTLHGSQDLSKWQPIPFRLATDASGQAPRTSFHTGQSRIVQIEPMPGKNDPAARFYRLRVE